MKLCKDVTVAVEAVEEVEVVVVVGRMFPGV